MKTHNNHLTMKALVLSLLGTAQTVSAVNLNYESLSSLEKPIATHIGDTTISLTGLIDAGIDLKNDETISGNSDTVLNSNVQINAETQLDNSVTIGSTYFGEYNSNSVNAISANKKSDNYDGKLAVYASGVWGTVSAGDVTGLVREDTRRRRGAGNAALNYDNAIGQLNDSGIAYIGRYGPMKISTSADKDGNFTIGASYQRPLGNKDYRFATRFSTAEFQANDTTTLESNSVSGLAELTYGSSVYDVNLGIETLEAGERSIDRSYASLGFARKIGLITLSAAAHFGDVEGQKESAYALGASVDIARGISLNLGINHKDSKVAVNGIEISNEEGTEAIASARYSY